jgi:hypothetical protein
MRSCLYDMAGAGLITSRSLSYMCGNRFYGNGIFEAKRGLAVH